MQQEEYLRAYYAAILKSQQEASQAAATANEPSNTEQNAETVADGSAFAVKKEEGEEDDDDVEWEDAPAAGIFAPNASFQPCSSQRTCKFLILISVSGAFAGSL